jgi:hypothetical protein
MELMGGSGKSAARETSEIMRHVSNHEFLHAMSFLNAASLNS